MIDSVWFGLETEIAKYLRANSFPSVTNWVTCEPDLINSSVILPVILLEWAGSRGNDINNDTKRSDRVPIIALSFFIETHNPAKNLNTLITQEFISELHSKLRTDLKGWNCVNDKINYPYSHIVNWGDIPQEFPAKKTINKIETKGVMLVVDFHYKGAIDE